jgi:integrase
MVVIARQHGDTAAARAHASLGGFFTWAIRSGLTESNPVANTLKPGEAAPRERVLSDDELGRIWRACDDDDEYGRAVRLLILLGCRRQEIGSMRWSEIDVDKGTWTIAATRSKNGRSHALPLLPLAMRLVDKFPRMVGRDPLFGTRGSGFGRWTIGKSVLDAASGVTGWILHDIRRTVATRMNDIGVRPHIVEVILNHVDGVARRGVTGIYNKSAYANEVRSALGLWEDHVHTLIDGGERRILPIRS